MAGFNLSGLQAVLAQLKSVAEETQPKVLRSAMRAAFKPVQDTAKALVENDPELRESIALGSAKVDNGAIAVGLMIVGNSTRIKQARVAAAAFGEAQSTGLPPMRRWHFKELGTAHEPPRPFLRPAMLQKAEAVVEDLARQVDKKILAAVKKAAR